METRISLGIEIDDETGKAQLQVYVSKWDGSQLKYNANTYRGDTICAPIRLDQSTYPYAVASLRDATDRVVAVLLERIARGETQLMHETFFDKEVLRVAASWLLAGRPLSA